MPPRRRAFWRCLAIFDRLAFAALGLCAAAVASRALAAGPTVEMVARSPAAGGRAERTAGLEAGEANRAATDRVASSRAETVRAETVRAERIRAETVGAATEKLAAAAPADAAPPPASGAAPDGGFAGEPVEILAERPNESARAPAAQGTVVEVARFGGEVRSVSELLATAPGVSLHALGGPGQAATLSLRGATADESLVLLDGIPLQGPGGGAIDLATLPATLLERIVVSRGVLGAQFGAGALGGAVELFPRASGETAGFGVQAGAGSFGTAQLAADGTVRFGESGSVIAGVQLDRTSGEFPFARQVTPEATGSPYYAFTRENADAKRASFLIRAETRPTPSTTLDAIVQATAGDRGLPGPSTQPTLRSRSKDQGAVAGGRLRGIAGAATWSVRAYGRLDRILLSGVQRAGDCADGDADCPRFDQRSAGARVEAELGAPLGERQWLRFSATAGDDFIAGAPTGAHDRPLVSAALADDLRLPGHVQLHPALRLDRSGRDTALSPALTAKWQPAESSPLELRAGAGLSFRPATFSELYLDSGGVLPDPTLPPERAGSLDAGVAWRTRELTLSGGVFWSSYEHLIIYEFFPPARVKPFSIGSARISGVELQAVVSLPAGFTAEASYSLLKAINREQGAQFGHRLSYRPPHRVFARLARRGDRLEGYGELAWTSAMPRNRYDSALLDAQLVLNAGAGVRALGPLWLDVEVKNLLDEQTHEDLFQYPLPGLSLSVLVRARL